jgi:hypothetical protein
MKIKSCYGSFCYSYRIFLKKDLGYFLYFIQHCFICRPSDYNVSEDARMEPSTDATLALADRYSKHIRIFISFQILNVIPLFICFKYDLFIEYDQIE